MDFGKNLSELIEKNKLSKKEVAAALGIAPNTLSGYINNKRQPDLDMLIKIADYFHTSTDYLLDYKSLEMELKEKQLNAISKKLSSLDMTQLDFLLKVADDISGYFLEKK